MLVAPAVFRFSVPAFMVRVGTVTVPFKVVVPPLTVTEPVPAALVIAVAPVWFSVPPLKVTPLPAARLITPLLPPPPLKVSVLGPPAWVRLTFRVALLLKRPLMELAPVAFTIPALVVPKVEVKVPVRLIVPVKALVSVRLILSVPVTLMMPSLSTSPLTVPTPLPITWIVPVVVLVILVVLVMPVMSSKPELVT